MRARPAARAAGHSRRALPGATCPSRRESSATTAPNCVLIVFLFLLCSMRCRATATSRPAQRVCPLGHRLQFTGCRKQNFAPSRGALGQLRVEPADETPTGVRNRKSGAKRGREREKTANQQAVTKSKQARWSLIDSRTGSSSWNKLRPKWRRRCTGAGARACVRSNVLQPMPLWAN